MRSLELCSECSSKIQAQKSIKKLRNLISFFYVYLMSYATKIAAIMLALCNGSWKQWWRKLEKLWGASKFQVKGFPPFKNSFVLTHLSTAYGWIDYFSWFFFPFVYFSTVFLHLQNLRVSFGYRYWIRRVDLGFMLKQYYEMSWERKIFSFHFFFIIHLCNDPCCHRIISPQCIRAGYFA